MLPCYIDKLSWAIYYWLTDVPILNSTLKILFGADSPKLKLNRFSIIIPFPSVNLKICNHFRQDDALQNSFSCRSSYRERIGSAKPPGSVLSLTSFFCHKFTSFFKIILVVHRSFKHHLQTLSIIGKLF